MIHLLSRSSSLPVLCYQCGHETRETIAQLEQKSELACSACGQVIGIDTQALQAALERTEFLLHDIGRGLGRQFRSTA